MVPPTLQKMSLKEAHESFSSNSREPVHEDWRLQIEELDEWRTNKPRTPDKSKLRQNEPYTSANQLKVGDKVLLDAADPHIVTTTLNEEIPLTVLSIFPFGTVEAFNVVTRKENHHTSLEEEERSIIFRGSNRRNSSPSPAVPPRASKRAFPNTSGPTVDCGFLNRLGCHRISSDGWRDSGSLNHRPVGAILRDYRADIPLAHYGTLLNVPSPDYNDKSTGIVNTHDVYFLLCMSQGHVIDLAYFIALVIQHQTERHQKGVISIGPYMTRLARHFGLLNTVAQESSLTLIGQMSPQGISSMLSMRMIERRRGTYPPQYCLAQSTEKEAYEGIPDDAPHSTRTNRHSHHHPLVQFMRRLHILTSLSISPDSSSSVFNDLTTLMLLYSRFISTSTSHRQSHLANHPAMKMIYGLMNLYDRRSILLHPQTDYSPKLQFEEFIIQKVLLLSLYYFIL
ncbi:hypothetical protein GOBAR_AA10967 [Gossypium barbadense]|uniref:Uncharacterized protein n=1 Tax=Gossypium barbadense TaxID=3634 RepID=A0A2P5Y284_GOSBA|nr:hypothetical protein GOBAR_AA10967 [Gossypium barbadense]